MRLCPFLCTGLSVCAALASPVPATLELWLSTDSHVASFPVPGNPVLPAGYTGKVYLYARTPGAWQAVTTTYADNNGTSHPWTFTDWIGDVWIGIGVGSSTTINFSGPMVNPSVNGWTRWLTQSNFVWSNSHEFTVAGFVWGNNRCVGMAAPPNPPGTPGASAFDTQQATTVSPVPGNSGQVYTQLGSITVSNAPAGASFFMTVGTKIMARHFGNPVLDAVQFGIGDAPVNAGIAGGISSLPDMTVAPEPATLLILGVATVALRRR